MSCCGQSRAQASQTPATTPGLTRASKPAYGAVIFEYTGLTRLTVIGPVTRSSYHFDGHGARRPVDGRDGVALATVPALRRV
jgi:hypothetical protein